MKLATPFAFATSLALAAALAPAAVVLSPNLLSFEGLVGTAPVPPGYGGIDDWGGWATTDVPDPDFPQQFGSVYAYATGPGQRVRLGSFHQFLGAEVITEAPFSWKLYYQGQHVATSDVLQPNLGGPAVHLGVDYIGPVDELEVVSTSTRHSIDGFTYDIFPGGLFAGVPYCDATPNSSGVPTYIGGQGSNRVTNNDLRLFALDLPIHQFGIFLASRGRTFVPGVGGASNGNLCVGGGMNQVGRFVGPGQILSSGPDGWFSLQLDLGAIPEGNVFVQVQPGETWHFQAWFRDPVGLGSNFTNGTEIRFQ